MKYFFLLGLLAAPAVAADDPLAVGAFHRGRFGYEVPAKGEPSATLAELIVTERSGDRVAGVIQSWIKGGLTKVRFAGTVRDGAVALDTTKDGKAWSKMTGKVAGDRVAGTWAFADAKAPGGTFTFAPLKAADLAEPALAPAVRSGSIWKGTFREGTTDAPAEVFVFWRSADRLLGEISWTIGSNPRSVEFEGTVTAEGLSLYLYRQHRGYLTCPLRLTGKADGTTLTGGWSASKSDTGTFRFERTDK